MKKYITTSKHPELKEGVILIKNSGSEWCIHKAIEPSFLYAEYNITIGLEKGYIKELEPKEFTASDMESYASFAADHDRYDCLDLWLKTKK